MHRVSALDGAAAAQGECRSSRRGRYENRNEQ